MSTRSRYSNFSDVDEYLMSLDDGRQSSLAKLRMIIRKTAPKAAEVMRYNMPYYEYKGMLCAFTAQEQYLSFYVLDSDHLEKMKDELPGLKLGTGCIRFQSLEDLPDGLIERLLIQAMAVNESRETRG
jgi:uncharacterized protein YdhG (YjbR/CyaY superfamily)